MRTDPGRRRHGVVRSAVSLVTVAFGVVLIAGCASPTAVGRHGASGPATSVTATSNDGTRLRVPGQRPAVLYFLSTSCAPVGLPAISSTKNSHPAADYVAVDIDQGVSPGQVRQYLAAAGAGGLAVAADADGAAMAAYRVSAEGTIVVVGPHGGVTYSGVDPSAGRLATAVTTAVSR
jgi:hypothetical protein